LFLLLQWIPEQGWRKASVGPLCSAMLERRVIDPHGEGTIAEKTGDFVAKIETSMEL
jgi:hypothetical protein